MRLKHLYLSLATTLLLSMAFSPCLRAESDKQNDAETVELATAAKSFISIDRGHYTTGRIKMIGDRGKTYLEFDKAFSTLRGPELKVILYRDASVPFSLELLTTLPFGTGIVDITCSIIASGVTRSIPASALTGRRWQSAGIRSLLTSSGMTKSLP